MSTPISSPRLCDRRLHTLYILFGILGSKLIHGRFAGMPIKEILLRIVVYDPVYPVPYGIHF